VRSEGHENALLADDLFGQGGSTCGDHEVPQRLLVGAEVVGRDRPLGDTLEARIDPEGRDVLVIGHTYKALGRLGGVTPASLRR